MTTVVVQDPEVAEHLIKERQTLGHDLYDEKRKGVYYVVPVGKLAHGRLQMAAGRVLESLLGDGYVVTGPINLGEEDDYRIPDAAAMPRDSLSADDEMVWVPSAELVVEIRSVDDDTYEKFDHYARHGVREIVVVEMKDRGVRLYELGDANIYGPVPTSTLLDLTAEDLARRIGL